MDFPKYNDIDRTDEKITKLEKKIDRLTKENERMEERILELLGEVELLEQLSGIKLNDVEFEINE